ncbi:hypothetical protein B7463_g9002, partial [Scytalidium lignicola]
MGDMRILGEFDVGTARNHFPALHQRQIFFDNTGGSQTLGSVISSISNYLSRTNVQLGATYDVGRKSSAAFKAGYDAAAKYINASPEETVFGASTTQLLRNLSFAIDFSPGDEIIISIVDHEANIAPWVGIASRQNLTVKWWIPRGKSNPKLCVEDLRHLLSERTKLVTCTHVSNILGSIHDIKGIGEAVHKNSNALLCVDGVAFAPHRRINVKELGVDFYVFSWYKVYGPHISMLYASHHAQKSLVSFGHYFNPTETLLDKIGLAASNYELSQTIPHVVAYFGPDLNLAWRKIGEHEFAIVETLLFYLRSRLDVTIYGESVADTKLRVPIVSFSVNGYGSREVVEKIEKETDFGFRWGMMYSNRLIKEILGLDDEGVVRVGMAHYNTVDEIRLFIKIFDEIIPQKQ